MPMIPFNKISNALRRLDEADPDNAPLRPKDELYRGGFSAQRSRLSRAAKSRRKTAERVHTTRHLKLS